MITATSAPVAGFIDKIPVRNIWLLLLYASQLYCELPQARRVELEEAPDDIPELVAEILTNAVERRLRRNLAFGYRRRADELNRLRGRIDLLHTERRQLLQRARVACIYDQLTVDTPRNRYVKAALLRLGSIVENTDLAPRCRNLAARLEQAGVTTDADAGQRGRSLRPEGPGWMDADERRMLAAARLAFDLSLPTEQTGRNLLAMADRSGISKLYEYAVAGFYSAVLSRCGWKVKHGGRLHWPIENRKPSLVDLMPQMETDIVLECRPSSALTAGRRIVIDTKFRDITVTGQYGKLTFRSENIYQIYAYLRSQENPEDLISCNSSGVLLYPSLEIDYNEAVVIQGHEIRFATVDLAADSPTIRAQLLRVVHCG